MKANFEALIYFFDTSQGGRNNLVKKEVVYRPQLIFNTLIDKKEVLNVQCNIEKLKFTNSPIARDGLITLLNDKADLGTYQYCHIDLYLRESDNFPLKSGDTFLVSEGPKIVGYGTIKII